MVTAGSTAAAGRLARLSQAMMWVTTLGIVVPDWTRNLLLARLGQLGGALVVAAPVAVMLYGLWAVRALFREFACGRVFTERAARYLQTFAITVLAQAPLGPLTSAARSRSRSSIRAANACTPSRFRYMTTSR